jgi:hypothetical protein
MSLRILAEGRLSVTFVTSDGDRTTLQVNAGDSLLDIAHEHDIDLEGTPTLQLTKAPVKVL